ncbi:MAG: xanthine dehydrogenase family protein molybdopterin-binding subunit [Burkholderiales bacterium]|nr:xanthine dehydrogenase family protein molybdopterin-binding subunit [Burkholderiales bacterium]
MADETLSRTSGQLRIGQPVRRLEDDALLAGVGRFIDDLERPGVAHAVFVRSPHAHARIRSIDSAAARVKPGVLAVYTAKDLNAAGIGPMVPTILQKNRDGSAPQPRARPVLAGREARYVGEAVAMVVAESVQAAQDAAEAVAIDYETLAQVTDPRTALAESAQDNLALDWQAGDAQATEAAFARAAHVARVELVVNRVSAAPVEPRGALGEYARGRYTLTAPTQGSKAIQNEIASTGLVDDPRALRVLTPEVGGSFGMKIGAYPEQVAVLHAARALGRPVHWYADRSEAFLADGAGRDLVMRGELALDADGRFTAVRARVVANSGAYASASAFTIPTSGGSRCITGVYDLPCYHLETRVAYTNTAPVVAYRGAGKPEFTYLIERLVDRAARDTGRDRAELRRINMVPTGAMPYTTPLGLVFDSGEFAKNMDDALALTDYAGFERRRREAAARGRLRGYGLSVYQEPDGYYDSHVRAAFDAEGVLSVHTTAQANGQGHVTTFTQLVSQKLGLPLERIRIVQGDSDRVGVATGTGGSRETTVTGTAFVHCAQAILEKGRLIAAHRLEAPAADIDFEVTDAGGAFVIAGTDRRMTIEAVARAAHADDLPAGLEPGLEASDFYQPSAYSFPSGCHVCEVEIDPDTGEVVLVAYSAVNDFGVVVNPLLLEGQVHGGVAQGIGQALCEQLRYDAESGQLLTGSFMDYCLPRAAELPLFGWARNEIPCRTNPLGVKGCGESGCTASLAAVMSAVLDALASRGVTQLDMPATPERVWRALGRAR